MSHAFDEQLREIGAAAIRLSAQLAEVPARVANELECMGVGDKKGTIREFLYRSECDSARRGAHNLALKINALIVNNNNIK
ncbi:ETS [Dione juno nucleopolyhedrovirus]|uniref:ETS n=1 Tax=Dione juno nucleopolyhedrovirus TaxID=2594175 RepID=A0AAE6H2U8_9ABAC|nr:ETS [Dione juno nucleopolyhedrovirus]QDL56989.1 ETS [Dione juno nucleopolyhedrovirus]